MTYKKLGEINQNSTVRKFVIDRMFADDSIKLKAFLKKKQLLIAVFNIEYTTNVKIPEIAIDLQKKYPDIYVAIVFRKTRDNFAEISLINTINTSRNQYINSQLDSFCKNVEFYYQNILIDTVTNGKLIDETVSVYRDINNILYHKIKLNLKNTIDITSLYLSPVISRVKSLLPNYNNFFQVIVQTVLIILIISLYK